MSRHHRGRNWQRLSREAKIRAGYRCEKCGRAGALQTHHRTPLWKGGTHDRDNLIVLCARCHYRADRGAGKPGRGPPDPPRGRERRGLSPEWRELVEGL